MSEKKRATDDELGNLHDTLARILKDRVSDKECTAAELNVARQFLKDNNITSVPAKGSPLGDLVNQLPFSVDEDNDLDEVRH